ncbi:MAG TPA: hypothetical protein VL598_08065 [Trinickia sp.]|jgi:hypothetical protein|uniref:hypothetical protein n=1 Tax=Trinickia sp. TaxID=2571163 RepID=UPI002D0041B1|nr:hypothetical protein [Trinickia sp.]HTI17604.1 hypothetical protein [Trinickia sp.]
MRHTVIAFFDTYVGADEARKALLAAGIADESMAMHARSEPTYATDATTVAQPAPVDEGLFANIEHFFESLFATQPPQPEKSQYSEAVRRGAVMLSVDAATDDEGVLARETLEHMHPIDIEERAATWSAPSDEALRERSPLEELGFRRGGKPRQRGRVHSYARQTTEQAEVDSGTARSTSGAVTPHAEQPSGGAAAPENGAEGDRATLSPGVPDEYLQNEEDSSDKGHGQR